MNSPTPARTPRAAGRIPAAAAAVAIFLAGPPASARDRRYLGAEKCKPCHEKAHQVWLASAHARTSANLTAEHQRELRCLFCHATDAAANLKEFRLSNVQCEACHGPGERHVQLAGRRIEPRDAKPGGLEPVSESRCRECHVSVRSPNLQPFDFPRAREAIKHW